ncbi:MAG: metallophosphoesterase [Nitrososphaerota archaeon]|nr:metallophosphoesterase [Aigarchaeota archaeon]MDW8076837.1 metallophosphoesterase [Nitrososphaerota archaeon]
MFKIPEVPALLVERPIKSLIISDVHIGFEEELHNIGFRVPSQSWKLVEEIKHLIEKTGVKRLIILGDLKHKVPGTSKIEWRYLSSMVEDVRRIVDEVILVPGNHDAGIVKVLGNSVVYAPSRGLVIEDGEHKVGLFHGHTWPSINLSNADILVMGHIHPVVRLRAELGFTIRKRVWLSLETERASLVRRLRRQRNLKTPRGRMNLLVMPSFNDFLSGVAVNAVSEGRELLGPIMKSGLFDLSKAEVYMLDGTHLGKVSDLREFA